MNLNLTSAAMMAFVPANVTLAHDPTTWTHSLPLAIENDEAQVVDLHHRPHQSSKLDSHHGGIVVYVTEASEIHG